VRPATEIHRPSGEQSGTPELGGHEGHLAVGPDVVEDEDVRMIQRGDVTGFMLEPIAARPVCRQLGRKHLQRDFTAQPRVARAIDLAHAASAERADDLVLPDACAWCHGPSSARKHDTITPVLSAFSRRERPATQAPA
jgi:hypothetical protein